MSYLWYWPAGGWDWNAWRDRQSWQPVPTATPESADNTALPPLPATSLAEWEREAPRLRRAVDDILGALTDTPPPAPAWEWIGPEYLCRTAPSGGRPYTLQRLRYALTDDGEWGYAWLLRPEAMEPGVKLPVVIALHQTVTCGKGEAAGFDTMPDRPGVRDYGAQTAALGFVVLIPDAIGFGERQSGHGNARYRSADQFFERHPDGSVMAKMAYDTSRAVDLLETLPGIDASRIGCLGHSHGGYGTLFAMLADSRIGAGIISCGLSPLRTDPGVDRWWRRTALLPRLGLYEGAMENVPFDFHTLIALVAPRPLLVFAAAGDTIFPNSEALMPALDEARRVYALYGASDSLHGLLLPGEHRYAPEAFDSGSALLRETFDLSMPTAGEANA